MSSHTPEALSVADAISVVLGTLNGNAYGLTVEDQFEALRMACRELEASNAAAVIAAAREALRDFVGDKRIERVMHHGRQGWKITEPDGEWCIVQSDWNDPPVEAKASAALEGLGGGPIVNPPSG